MKGPSRNESCLTGYRPRTRSTDIRLDRRPTHTTKNPTVAIVFSNRRARPRSLK